MNNTETFYHGSCYLFDRFSSAFLGAGEGKSKFGHGIYITSSYKTAALYALIDQAILGLESFRPDVKDDAMRFFLYWKDQKSLFDALRSNNLSNLLLERMVLIVLDEDYDIRYRLSGYDWNTGTDSIVFNLCGIMGLTYSWYNTGYQRTPEEMAQQINLLVQQPRMPGNS